MNSLKHFIGLSALVITCGAATASGLENTSVPNVLPVLVNVDTHGKVTGVSPAMELSPKLTRLLRANLDEMINAPATDKDGSPTSSQFVINLALQSSPREQGDYDAAFTYVSTTPVPSGSWYWVHTDGRQLALASQSSQNSIRDIRSESDRVPNWRENSRMPTNGTDGPRTSAAERPSPAPDPEKRP